MAAQIFISYAPEDEVYRNELVKHLKLLQTSGIVSVWHDRKILPGSIRGAEIDTHLNSADLILLLISVDFINSDYCWHTEVKRAVERHRAGEAVVIPVIVRTVDWQAAPFGQLKPLPEGGKPVRTWASMDIAMDNIVRGVRQLIEAHQQAIAEKTFYEHLKLFISDGHLSSEEREILIHEALDFGLTVQQVESLIDKEKTQKQTYTKNLKEYEKNFFKFSRRQYPSDLTSKQEEILGSQQRRWQLSENDIKNVRNQVIHQLELEYQDSKSRPEQPEPGKFSHRKNTFIASAVLIGLGILSLGGAFWFRLSGTSQGNVCPPDLDDGISSGEETVFSRNTTDGGGLDKLDPIFKAFRECNDYSTAISHLQTLLNQDSIYRKDPELIIYLNNAKARLAEFSHKDRKPYVLAVVIPASAEDSADVAQEILRGVADAQEKFNLQQENAQGKLLEIVIADDQDNPAVASSKAAQLISDSRILGVIGHRSSEVTAAALDTYKAAGASHLCKTHFENCPLR
jgi:hypothetical protein